MKSIYINSFIVLLILSSKFSAALEARFILKEEKKGDKKILYIDINQDKKVDRIEKYQKDFLKELEVDRNFSGQINEWISYFKYQNDLTPIEIKKIDSNQDNKVDRIEKVFKNLEFKILVVKTEVDKNFDGKMDDNFSTHSELNQQDEAKPCAGANPLDKLNVYTLVKDVGHVNDSLKIEYYEEVGGYKIHKSCMENWGAKNFADTLKSSMNTGIQCLKRLAEENNKNNIKPNGAYNNLKNLDFLFSNNKVTIVCNEINYKWKDVAAHASTSPSDGLKSDSKVRHPFLSINPNDPELKSKASAKELSFMKKTLFHEQLHNLGIRHSEDVEFPYTCETCCMPDSEDKKELIEASCKVCSGGYTGANDPKFIQDFITWGKHSYSDARVTKSVIKFLKENKGDKQGVFFLAESNAGIFNPLGSSIAAIIKSKIKPLTKDQKETLARAEEYKDVDFLNRPSVKKLSGIVADSMYSHYYEGNTKSMLDKIALNKAEIKALINIEKTATGNDQYIYKGLKEQLKNTLVDVWINTYGEQKTPEANQAYELLDELKLI